MNKNNKTNNIETPVTTHELWYEDSRQATTNTGGGE